MAPARKPLLSFTSTDVFPMIQSGTHNPYSDDCPSTSKPWYYYLPLCGTVLLILAPQPSWLCTLLYFHLQTLHRPDLFVTHLLISYTLLFIIFSSLLVCLVRDPGDPNAAPTIDGAKADEDELGLREALIADDDISSPNKWCRKCWAPKPERAHHCSICGRCVLKMDHHCPWIGAKCIGHRTYPAFVHFLCCVTLLATHFAIVAGSALWYTFNNHVTTTNEYAPIHEMLVMFTGVIFSLVIGSFAAYHLYLTSTNQTTIENITPFLLLRHLPPLPGGRHSLSDPPLEPELSFPQRRLVKDAHGQILLYNVGFKKNWASTFGWRSTRELLFRLWWGGSSRGDGKVFPRNPQSERMLAKLAKELVDLDTD